MLSWIVAIVPDITDIIIITHCSYYFWYCYFLPFAIIVRYEENMWMRIWIGERVGEGTNSVRSITNFKVVKRMLEVEKERRVDSLSFLFYGVGNVGWSDNAKVSFSRNRQNSRATDTECYRKWSRPFLSPLPLFPLTFLPFLEANVVRDEIRRRLEFTSSLFRRETKVERRFRKREVYGLSG